MPRRTGHIRQRSPGSFELRYSTIEPSGSRKTHTVTVKAKNQKEAEAELRARLHALDTGEHVPPSRLTVGQWLDTWVETVKHEVSPKTAEFYGHVVETYIKPKLGGTMLQKLTRAAIQKAYTDLAAEPRRDGKPGHLSATSRQHIHRVLRTALGRAVDLGKIASNPAAALRKYLPKIERHDFTALTPEQSATLLAGLTQSSVYWPVLIALSTGCRRGEILALRWGNIDLDQGTLRVVESLEETKEALRFKAPKNDRTRSMVLPAFAVAELRRHKREQAEALLKLGVRQDADTLVCCRLDGEPLPPHSLSTQFRRLAAKVKGVPHVRFHDLRHAHATQLLVAGTHAKVVQERLGHSTITLTLNTYSHITATMQQDAASRLDAALGAAIRAASESQ